MAFFGGARGALLGVVWWLPPTKPAAQSVSADWRNVPLLSQLVIAPEVPKNAATFIQARSIRLLPLRWTTLLTYAYGWRRHNGHIYKVFGWEYLGETEPKRIYTLDDRQISVKASPKTRTHAEMLEMGAICVGRSKKHKFRFVC